MLNEGDIDLMHEWRDEMMTHREREVSVIYLDKQRDPITNVIIGEKEESRPVNAVVTEVSTRKSNGSRSMEGGIIYEEGDIKVDIKIELIEGIADKITRINHDDKDYEVLGVDKKGIGRRNRYEFIGSEIA